MDKEYLDILKKTDLRPEKVKIKERKEEILMEAQDKANSDLHNQIIKWFIENPYPKDDAVHAFANELGVNEHEFEGHIYSILSNILTEGKSKGFSGSYDPEQIKMGIKVEYEHTDYTLISEKIAKDHLAEIPDYYTRLAKMEKAAGVEHSKEE
jgi:energy-converting hydrogenase A subunit M